MPVCNIKLMMLRNKYKLGRNNGLLPKIAITKSLNPMVTSYALLYNSSPRQYEVSRHPNQSNSFVLYNDKQYLHRHCSFVGDASKHKQTMKDVSELYPNNNFTLTIFVANEPNHCDQIILGHEKCSSLLMMAFKDLKKKKNHGTAIVFSIIGIENENSLTDQLNFEWIEKSKEEFNDQNPIKAIVKHKPKIKISKNMDSSTFVAENLSRHELKSESNLHELLTRYQQVKNYFEEWVSISDQTEYYSQGELYHLAEMEVDQEYGTITKVIRSHYILRVNQYLKSSAPFMLRLGMNLRRIQEDNSRIMDIHQSKIFKLLSECFTSRNDKNDLVYRFHYFMQVGLYPSLKEEYLNLAPTSDSVLGKKDVDSGNFQQISFFYIKQYMQYPSIIALVKQIQAKQKPKNQENLQQYLQNGQQLELGQKSLNKSYVCETFSSLEKRIKKDRVMTQQTPNVDRHLDLQELVHETAKIYRLDSVKKIKLPDSRNSFAQSRKTSAKRSFLKMSALQRIPGSTPRINSQTQKNKQKPVIKPVDEDMIIIQADKETEILRTNKFYSEAKEWLGFVYGPSSKQFKKIKGTLKRNEKSLKKAVDSITRQLLANERRQNRLASPKNN